MIQFLFMIVHFSHYFPQEFHEFHDDQCMSQEKGPLGQPLKKRFKNRWSI